MRPLRPLRLIHSMKRLGIILLGVCALALIAGFASLIKSDPPPHVIFISMDTTRADFFGCYGNPWIKTPRVDALAKDSILLANYHTVAPTTLSSHSTLFTGKYPHHHGVPSNGFILNAANVTLAETLKSANFQTAGIIGSFALDSRFRIDQGFDFYNETMTMEVGPNKADQEQRHAGEVTDAAIEYLDKRENSGRLFLFVHYFDPHAPYLPPEEFATMYSANDPAIKAAMEKDAGLGRVMSSGKAPDPLRDHIPYVYAGEISYMDREIGRLLDELDRRDILENSILVLTSDHGETLWEHLPAFNHGRNVYEGVLKTFGLIRLPHRHLAGTVLKQWISNIEIMPTVLQLLGLSLPPAMDGKPLDLSAEGIAKDSEMTGRVFCEATQPIDGIPIDPRWGNAVKSNGIISDGYKFIRTNYLKTEELYDLPSDPHETTNLLTTPTQAVLERADSMRKELEAWNQTANPLETEFERKQWEDTIAKLKKMGYL